MIDEWRARKPSPPRLTPAWEADHGLPATLLARYLRNLRRLRPRSRAAVSFSIL
jgi:hypothetical protein